MKRDRDSEVLLTAAAANGAEELAPIAEALVKFPGVLERAAEAKAKSVAKAEEVDAQQLLPFWPEKFRALPSEIFRSALFNARNKRSKREYMKEREIVVIGPGRVTHTGRATTA